MHNDFDNFEPVTPKPKRRFSFKLPRRSSEPKARPLLWTLGASLSIALNLVLLLIVIIFGRGVFKVKQTLTDELVGGLYYNFVLMDQAEISATILVEDRIPVQFDLPLDQHTRVVLSEPTPINNARVSLSTGGLNITNAPADIVLPTGTELPVHLNLVVPVDAEIPVVLNVPVSIPLNETELHQPFTGLQEVVSPYYELLNDLPGSWREVRCRLISWGCED